MSENQFVNILTQRCRDKFARPTLALPEGDDARIVEAAVRLLDDGVFAKVVLFGDPGTVMPAVNRACAGRSEVCSAVQVIDPMNYHDHALSFLQQRYQGKPIVADELVHWAQSPLYQAGVALAESTVDVVVAGAVATTADVIRAAVRTVGMHPEIKFLSGSFFMARDDESYLFSDCGVLIEPNLYQLLDIARGSVRTWQVVKDESPVVGFLSFSTMGSASHPSAEKMQKAANMFAQAYPEVACVGEVQFDAAIDRSIGLKKGIDENLAGRCNIFIFPNLDAGNIAYKITQRLGRFHAFGPLLQGLQRGYGDLSRGASVNDIVNICYINLLLTHPA